MAHPNEDLVRRGYEAFAKGDAVLGFFGKTIELTADTFRVEVHDVVAADRHTVGLHLATGQREGRTP